MEHDDIKRQKEALMKRYTDGVNNHFEQWLPYLNDELLWPEMRYVRDEIIDCLLTGTYQAAITLTNHFLEKSLKMALVYHSTGGKKVHFADQMQTYEEALAKFGDSDLSQTINACCSKGLIDKERKKTLQRHRDTFRNAYGHASADKTFGTLTAPSAILPTGNPAHYKIEVNTIASMPYIQGMAQQLLAEMDAIPYFKYVYETHKLLEQSVENPQQ